MNSLNFIAKFIGSYGYDFRDQDAPDYGANGTYSAVGNIIIYFDIFLPYHWYILALLTLFQ